MKAMVCTQCGAPLHGRKCDYCGAEYEQEEPTIEIDVDPRERERDLFRERFRNAYQMHLLGIKLMERKWWDG